MPEIDDQTPSGGANAAPSNASPYGWIDLNHPGWGEDLYAGGASPDPGKVLGRLTYHMALGAKPEDFHPNLRPLAETVGMMLQPEWKPTMGILGDLRSHSTVDALNPEVVNAGLGQTNAKLDATPPSFDATSTKSNGPLGLRGVDGLPIEKGSHASPRFDGLITDDVQSFFGAMKDQGIPVELRSGFRTHTGQFQLTGNKNGGAKAGNSLHEAGTAFDVNWDALNPFQQQSVLKAAREHGFKWGGHFKAVDPGHFYVDPFDNLAERQAYIRGLGGSSK